MMIVRIGRDGGTVEAALMVAVPEEKWVLAPGKQDPELGQLGSGEFWPPHLGMCGHFWVWNQIHSVLACFALNFFDEYKIF
jgi:hypothetical protein